MATPSIDRDALLHELAAAVTALDALPPDAFSDRIDLRDRLNELRAALADPSEGRTRASLEQELAQLEAQLDRLHADRPIVAAMSGAGEGDDGIAEAQRLAQQYDEGACRGGLEQRVAQIRRALEAIVDTTE